MLIWTIVVATVSALTCPRVQCTSTPNDQCVRVAAGELTLSPCANATSVCPPFSVYTTTNANCTASRRHHSDSRCLKYYEENQQCDLNRPCQTGFYCHQPDGRCLRKSLIGNVCNDLWECLEGSVCNKGYCVKYFSIDEGQLSDSRIACKSGIVHRGVCAKEAKSLSQLPVYCEKDDDCKASDHSFGTCKCAYGGNSTGICSLHASDDPVKEFLVALHNGKVETATYLQKRILTYPRSEYSDTCVRTAEKELVALDRMRHKSKQCWAAALQLASVLLALLG